MLRLHHVAFAVLLPLAALAENQSAFRALQSVPTIPASKLARIGGCEGTPTPGRWHFVVHDPQQLDGFSDYVVADGRLVARNGVSQFAREVRPEDVLPTGSVRVDSDRVAVVAQEYATANDAAIASMNYELRTDPVSAQPVWKVTCFDGQSRTIGWLVLDAKDGSVLARGGFLRAPLARLDPIGEPLVQLRDADTKEAGDFHPPTDQENDQDDQPAIRPRHIEVRRAEVVRLPPPPRELVEPLRVIRKLLPF